MDGDARLQVPPVIREATPTAPYSLRAPSPPHISVPVLTRSVNQGQEFFHMVPSTAYIDASHLTTHDFYTITRNTTQYATDRAASWSYAQRRNAQSILDFLYLGPTSIVRDHGFLRDEGITMIVVVRDTRMGATPLMSVTRAAEALGLQVYYVNIDGLHQLIGGLSAIIRDLNNHLLQVYRESEASGAAERRRGKILVSCDTGNDRSAAVVCAYIMTMFGNDLLTTLQFVSIQRFCCTFDEDIKRMLQTYGDILRARAAVAADEHTTKYHNAPIIAKNTKRGFDSTVDVDMDSPDTEDSNPDVLRFNGRQSFAPFADTD
ncbi:hypothetical protein K4F52_004871 [Lecanicillium sp. MT-2017a]|nr:hypothetical protein K4F52_004871 [Lecanicillium sp. MT-2017a]